MVGTVVRPEWEVRMSTRRRRRRARWLAQPRSPFGEGPQPLRLTGRCSRVAAGRCPPTSASTRSWSRRRSATPAGIRCRAAPTWKGSSPARQALRRTPSSCGSPLRQLHTGYSTLVPMPRASDASGGERAVPPGGCRVPGIAGLADCRCAGDLSLCGCARGVEISGQGHRRRPPFPCPGLRPAATPSAGPAVSRPPTPVASRRAGRGPGRSSRCGGSRRSPQGGGSRAGRPPRRGPR